jgi:ubiquinone/menaquinone biosynthesis C-methylase UbiE
MNTRKFYNNMADEYNFRNSNPTTLLLRKKENKLIRKFARGRILDLGCGTGYHIKALENSIGTDVSEEMLRGVKPAWKPLIQSDIVSIPFKDKVFDTVLCMHSVLNIVDPAKSAREISRILKPNGLVILSVASIYDNNYSLKEKRTLKPGPHSKRKRFSISKKTLSMRLFTKKDLTQLFSKNRLDLIHFDSLFSRVRPRWNNLRDFTPREKLTLRLEELSQSRYGCIYLMVFRKR